MKKRSDGVKKAIAKEAFPREGMKYEDRFQMVIGKYGRDITISLNRGKAVCSEDGRTVTITYKDSKVRGPRVEKNNSN